MSIAGRIFGIINGVFLIGFLYLIIRMGSILAFLGSSIGILIALIPIIVGLIFSIKSLLNKQKKLGIFDKFLVAFPIINTLFILTGILLAILN